MARAEPRTGRISRNRESGRSALLARLGFHSRSDRRRSKSSPEKKRPRLFALAAGLDRLNPRSRRSIFPPRRVVPALAAAVLVALGMAALRIDLIRARYEIGMNYSSERSLNRKIAELTARMRELRDPLRLSERAMELGFVPPQRLIDLPLEPGRSDPGVIAARFSRPGVDGSNRP